MSTTNNRLTAEELQKLRQTDFSKKQGFVKAETVLAKEVGEVGTLQRAEFDAKARAWYYGEILRERRKELGMTQKELAEKSGTSLRMVQLYEQRKQDIRKAEAQTIVNLSRVLGCGVEDLFE